jgi:transposase-like protein
LDLTPSGRHKDKRDIYREEKMGTKDKERRVYSKELKVEAAAPVGKYKKPVRQVAADLGIKENVLRRWIRQARKAGNTGREPFFGHGRTRDEEPARLRKEVRR